MPTSSSWKKSSIRKLPITHVGAFTSAEEGAIIVSYIRKVSAHFAMHLSVLFMVIQPYKLWKPLVSKSTSSHLSLLFIFSPWRWLFLFCSFLAFCRNSTLNFIAGAWKTKTEKAHDCWSRLIDKRFLKMADHISHPRPPWLSAIAGIIHLVPSLPTPEIRDILAFRKWSYSYIFVYLLFRPAVWTQKLLSKLWKTTCLIGQVFLIEFVFYFPLNLFYSPTVNG